MATSEGATYRFECPECGDHEGGYCAADRFRLRFCGICAGDTGRDVPVIWEAESDGSSDGIVDGAPPDSGVGDCANNPALGLGADCVSPVPRARLTNRVTRDGDTVTVRCDRTSATLKIDSAAGGWQFAISGGNGVWMFREVFISDTNLAALGYELLALAGEPDWKSLALKLGRVVSMENTYHAIDWYRVKTTADGYREYEAIMAKKDAAYDALTDDEWTALEGARDD